MIAVRLYLTDSSALAGREEACFSLLTPKRRKEAASFRMQDARLLCCAAGLLLRRVLGVRSDEDLSSRPWLREGQSSACPMPDAIRRWR